MEGAGKVKVTPLMVESIKVVGVGAAANQPSGAESCVALVPEAVGHAVVMAPPLPVKPVSPLENHTGAPGCSAWTAVVVKTLFAVLMASVVMATVLLQPDPPV